MIIRGDSSPTSINHGWALIKIKKHKLVRAEQKKQNKLVNKNNKTKYSHEKSIEYIEKC
jgi:hypothetical protein